MEGPCNPLSHLTVGQYRSPLSRFSFEFLQQHLDQAPQTLQSFHPLISQRSTPSQNYTSSGKRNSRSNEIKHQSQTDHQCTADGLFQTGNPTRAQYMSFKLGFRLSCTLLSARSHFQPKSRRDGDTAVYEYLQNNIEELAKGFVLEKPSENNAIHITRSSSVGEGIKEAQKFLPY